MQPDIVSLYMSVEGQEWPEGGGWGVGAAFRTEGRRMQTLFIPSSNVKT